MKSNPEFLSYLKDMVLDMWQRYGYKIRTILLSGDTCMKLKRLQILLNCTEKTQKI